MDSERGRPAAPVKMRRCSWSLVAWRSCQTASSTNSSRGTSRKRGLLEETTMVSPLRHELVGVLSRRVCPAPVEAFGDLTLNHGTWTSEPAAGGGPDERELPVHHRAAGAERAELNLSIDGGQFLQLGELDQMVPALT